ncbi:MAG: hypothetical protein ACRYG8_10635 [Janthinobacterium lividum]
MVGTDREIQSWNRDAFDFIQADLVTLRVTGLDSTGAGMIDRRIASACRQRPGRRERSFGLPLTDRADGMSRGEMCRAMRIVVEQQMKLLT